MNMISGIEVTREQSLASLDNLHETICRTLASGELPLQRVVAACDELSGWLGEENCLPALLALGVPERRALAELAQAKAMLSRDYIEARLMHEFHELPGPESGFVPYGQSSGVTQAWKPLGVLLHIAAGNADALPLLSVIEGLITGNINLLKLPGIDDGLTVPLLLRLIDIEPHIADYVYVYDFPSTDTDSLKKLARAAHATVVWGGDAAVTAVRQAANPDTKIIEWGHKLSFAYVSGEAHDEALRGIAHNICDTDQRYCSSCQGIYLDTEDMDEVYNFSERFLRLLYDTAKSMERPLSLSLRAQKTLELYTEELESVSSSKRVYRCGDCSVIAYPDSHLQPSYMFRNCWVKPLPREKLISALLPYKNRLQTAALVCEESERMPLETALLRSGVVRITGGHNMSAGYCGLPHDGEYPLPRYMKRVSIDYES